MLSDLHGTAVLRGFYYIHFACIGVAAPRLFTAKAFCQCTPMQAKWIKLDLVFYITNHIYSHLISSTLIHNFVKLLVCCCGGLLLLLEPAFSFLSRCLPLLRPWPCRVDLQQKQTKSYKAFCI